MGERSVRTVDVEAAGVVGHAEEDTSSVGWAFVVVTRDLATPGGGDGEPRDSDADVFRRSVQARMDPSEPGRIGVLGSLRRHGESSWKNSNVGPRVGWMRTGCVSCIAMHGWHRYPIMVRWLPPRRLSL